MLASSLKLADIASKPVLFGTNEAGRPTWRKKPGTS